MLVVPFFEALRSLSFSLFREPPHLVSSFILLLIGSVAWEVGSELAVLLYKIHVEVPVALQPQLILFIKIEDSVIQFPYIVNRVTDLVYVFVREGREREDSHIVRQLLEHRCTPDFQGVHQAYFVFAPDVQLYENRNYLGVAMSP